MKKRVAVGLLISICCLSVAFAQKRLVILYTNDTHSQIEPFPSNDTYFPDRGGVVNRKALVDSIRRVEKNVLLIDAGDFVQGTPYYNLFHGRVETEAMNRIRYDVGTIGNHEFDEGIDSLKRMVEQLDFPMINCNYDFSATRLHGLIEPYIVLKKDGVRVGVVAVGTALDGMVTPSKRPGVVFRPIVESVNHYAAILRKQKKCDLIICLSHIGYDEDKRLAAASQEIDLIIGGHSHTYLEHPTAIKNRNGKAVLVYQIGSKGVSLGQITLEFKKK